MLFSVISIVRRSGLSPVSSSATAAASRVFRSRNWKTEEFTANCRSDRQRTAREQASDRTHWVSSVMWPLASAQGIRTPGGMGPSTGSRHRNSASKPSSLPVARSTAG